VTWAFALMYSELGRTDERSGSAPCLTTCGDPTRCALADLPRLPRRSVRLPSGSERALALRLRPYGACADRGLVRGLSRRSLTTWCARARWAHRRGGSTSDALAFNARIGAARGCAHAGAIQTLLLGADRARMRLEECIARRCAEPARELG
jgi:hypothetical protein